MLKSNYFNILSNVLKFSEVGISVSNINKSKEFFELIGFHLLTRKQEEQQEEKEEQERRKETLLFQNSSGLKLQLFLSDNIHEDNLNPLMDYNEKKYPGHTHIAFTIPSIQSIKEYFEVNDLKLSGERTANNKVMSVFLRDYDKTTYEFEINEKYSRNDNDNDNNNNNNTEEKEVITGDIIGFPRGLDHIGIRISNPIDRVNWYAEKLGFVNEIYTYEPNPNPLQNRRPWIYRTSTDVDINFILNTNETITENILFKGNQVLPGIIFIGFTVENVDESIERLLEAGVTSVTRDKDLLTSPINEFRLLNNKIISPENGNSVFLMDDDRNIIRLVDER